MLAPLGKINEITSAVIGSAIEVHRTLGPGLLESAYQFCLAFELRTAGRLFEAQKPLPLVYKGNHLDCGYRLDFVVDGLVVVDVKCADALAPIHSAQLLTYLKLTNCPAGLLINFNVPVLGDGIKRLLRPGARLAEGAGGTEK
jgi:GxxExxY protein